MSKAKENFEEIEIRSDGESDEDVENSEDEFFINDHSQEESFEINNDEMELNADLDSACDEDDDTPLSISVAEMDEIWEKKTCHINPPFTVHLGPKNLPENIRKPGDIFLCLFSEQNIQGIVEQSNLYCKQKGISFDAITSEEIKKFLGLNIAMGIKRLPSYRDYWSTNFQLNDPYISSVMSVKRFSFLFSNLHLNDSTKEPKRNEPEYDKLYKVRLYLNILSGTFKFFIIQLEINRLTKV